MTSRTFCFRDDTPYVVNVSGGRTSAYMLHMLLEEYDRVLPENALVAFMNTGKERTETLDFIHTLEQEWEVPIVWLEYRYNQTASGGLRDPKNTFAVVEYETASRNGEPFEALISNRNYLPNSVQRTCTHELKVNTLNRYMRAVHGVNRKQFVNLIGIRKDERKRVLRIFERDCNIVLPLFLAGITLADVTEFWSNNPFDLPFPKETSLFTNCDLCFMKGRHKLTRIIQNEPQRAEWWTRMETETKKKRDGRGGRNNAQFNKRYSIADLTLLAKEPVLFKDEDYQAASCFCGE